jgi:hypothetical protein
MSDGAVVTLGQAAEYLGLTPCAGTVDPQAPISGAVVGDLLSHVMAKGKHGNVWITIQVHPNIVAVAALDGLAAIVIADGFDPDEDTLVRAEEEGVPLYRSGESGFVLCGKLYELGVR